jgi:hypothetical protein
MELFHLPRHYICHERRFWSRNREIRAASPGKIDTTYPGKRAFAARRYIEALGVNLGRM